MRGRRDRECSCVESRSEAGLALGLWYWLVGWLVVPEVFPDSGSTLVLLAVPGSCVSSPAMEQMALAPSLVHTPGISFLSKKTDCV